MSETRTKITVPVLINRLNRLDPTEHHEVVNVVENDDTITITIPTAYVAGQGCSIALSDEELEQEAETAIA